MRAKHFTRHLNEKRLDPEMQKLLRSAKTKYPQYDDEETALIRQLSDDHKSSKKLEKDVEKLDKRVTKLEKNKKLKEDVGVDEASIIVDEVVKLIGEGHTEVSPDVITTKVSAALGRPFMLKDLVAVNNSSEELQHYIDSINPSKIKFSTDILTVKNQDPVKEKEDAQATVSNMASRAANRPRLGESVNEGWGRGTDRVTIPDDSTLYWSGKGPLQKEYDALYNELVPSMGKADTIEGEVLRAASKIVYRHYNDGDDFNQASFEQLVPYIGAVTSYDDLAHKATEFAIKANGNYTPNPNWDSLDVMEYGPEEYDDDDYEEDDSDWYDEEEEDEDEDLDEARTTWNNDFYVYDPKTKVVKKKFRTHKGAKQYAEANGLKVASAEYYHDSVSKEVDEGWESGPDERAPRERDPDAEYDDMRQQKADAEAQAQQAKRPQTKVYTLTGRGPNYEPNYAFPGEYATQDEADAARAKLMADPSTPNPRDIGISSRTKYLDEGRETPLRDREDYDAKKKALQDIQMDPHTSKDPELSTEVMRRLAGLNQQAKNMNLDVSEAKRDPYKILSQKLKDIEAQNKGYAVSDEEYAKHVERMKKSKAEYLAKNPESIYKK